MSQSDNINNEKASAPSEARKNQPKNPDFKKGSEETKNETKLANNAAFDSSEAENVETNGTFLNELKG